MNIMMRWAAAIAAMRRPPSKPERMAMISDSYAWDMLSPIDKLRVARFQSPLPVNLVGLAGDLGLTVKAATLEPGKSGEIRPDGTGNFIIKVNRHDSLGRQRFTVAHEIAHFLLHKHLIGAGISDDALYRSNQNDKVEREANRLAADIVMPTKAVANAIATAKALGLVDYEAALADQFQVSRSAMGIKLGRNSTWL